MTFPLMTFQALSRCVGASNRPGKGRNWCLAPLFASPVRSLAPLFTKFLHASSELSSFYKKSLLIDVAVYALSVPTVVALHFLPSLLYFAKLFQKLFALFLGRVK